MRMKTLIVYDSKRGSTEQICKWIAELLSNDVDIKRVSEVIGLEKYDLIVVGSPIYMDKPLNSVIKFLRDNKDKLKEKNVVLFAVGLATFKFTAPRYLKKMRKALGFQPLLEEMLPGKWGLINRMNRRKVEDFVEKIKKTILGKS